MCPVVALPLDCTTLDGRVVEYLRQICVLYDKLHIFVRQFCDFHSRLVGVRHVSVQISWDKDKTKHTSPSNTNASVALAGLA